MTSKLKVFHAHITDISAIFTRLLSAKQIVRDRCGNDLIQKANKLRRCFIEHLDKIKAVFIPWAIYLKHDSTGALNFIPAITAVTRDTTPFNKLACALISEIKAIFTTEISKRKSKEARQKQKVENMNGTTRRLGNHFIATQGQALDILQTLEDAADVVSEFSSELQMGLLHYNNRRPDGSSPEAEYQSELLPIDPFLVPDQLVSAVSVVLTTEITHLKVLIASSN